MDYTKLIDGCMHFTLHSALFLPSWNVTHNPTQQELANLTSIFQKLELVRSFLGNNPINVHCAIRPILNNPTSSYNGQDYNLKCGGAPHSAHKVGLAVDFDVSGLSCDDVRSALLPKLEEWGLRMEDKPKSSWTHLDCAPVPPGGHRYFLP